MMPVLLTRPEAQSQDFAARLRDRFRDALKVVISPLLEIQFLTPELPQDRYDALVFTSQNGVAAADRLNLPRTMHAWCVGDRTAEAARALGFEATSSGGDVDALSELIEAEAADQRLLHLSGRYRAGQLPGNVTSVVAYDQTAVALIPAAGDLLSNQNPVLIPIFSPRSAELFQAELREGLAFGLHAVCISENAARPLKPACFDRVALSTEPTAGAMLDAIARVLAPPPA